MPTSEELKAKRKQFYQLQPKCNFIISPNKKCNMTRIKNSSYCRWHTTQENTPSTNIYNPSPSIPSQSTDNESEDLSFEIGLLKSYLRKLIEGDKRKTIDPQYLKLQLQLIEQIRKLVHSLSIVQSQSKLYLTVTKVINSIVLKIVETIKKYNLDENIKEVLSNELMEIANNRNENDDLNKLLKTINPKHRYEV